MPTQPTKSKIQKFFDYMNDGGLWPLIIPFGITIFMLICAFFHLNNFYSRNCAAAAWWWKIIGLVFFSGVPVCIYRANNNVNSNWDSLYYYLGAFALYALAFSSFAGFVFNFA